VTGTEQDIVDVAIADGRFTTLVTALEAAGLVETLKGEGPFTVFAPTDDAFAELPPGTVDDLLNDIPALTDILLYHVVLDEVMAADVVNLTSADTALGEPLEISVVDGNVMINDATVVLADVEASNGVIHVIDAVLLPPEEGGTTTTTATTETTEPTATTTTTTTTSPTTTTTESTTTTTTSPTTTTTEPTTTTATTTTTETTATTSPTTTTTEPLPGEGTPDAGKSVTIEVAVANFSMVSAVGATDGDGYIVFYMDEVPAGFSEEVTVTETATEQSMVESIETSYTWENVTPGVHIFSVQLVDAEGNPLSPPVITALVITVMPE
jgi:hypothetical protein